MDPGSEGWGNKLCIFAESRIATLLAMVCGSCSLFIVCGLDVWKDGISFVDSLLYGSFLVSDAWILHLKVSVQLFVKLLAHSFWHFFQIPAVENVVTQGNEAVRRTLDQDQSNDVQPSQPQKEEQKVTNCTYITMRILSTPKMVMICVTYACNV